MDKHHSALVGSQGFLQLTSAGYLAECMADNTSLSSNIPTLNVIINKHTG